MMLYETFNANKESFGQDFFTSRLDDEIVRNLNPKFELREYQKEALGRFDFYFSDYAQKQKPVHLLFNMATGSGKTLIMAAQIIYLYKKGYRNFVFFTRLGNIIEKTKENFLNPLSSKYLFTEKIVIDGKEIRIKEVDSFDAANDEDINMIFSTTALLHSRFNRPAENSLSYEDFENEKVVLIADEAHNLSAETMRRKLTKEEQEDKTCWENTVMKFLNANKDKENILLEFTATARLEEQYPEIIEKYKDKAIFRYDFTFFRQDGFSKDVKTVQIDATLKERVLAAVIISQYRRKIAQKNGINLKPIVLFKANRVTEGNYKLDIGGRTPQVVVSKQFKDAFNQLIRNLNAELLEEIKNIKDETLQKAFNFFEKEKIDLDNLVIEIKNDFSEEKCLSVDEEKELTEKQILLNALEDKNNEIRVVFATEKLNEGWDVLNLFDIVRLYDSRDARENRPGRVTVQEAQLIGRGARYFPFTLDKFENPYIRKFDYDSENELRLLEVLYYHSASNSRYIQELESVLKKEGIIPSRIEKKEIKIKDSFKNSYFWKEGLLFLNKKEENLGEDIFSLKDAKVYFETDNEENVYKLPTRRAKEKYVFKEEILQSIETTNSEEVKLIDLGQNVLRTALDKQPLGSFDCLKNGLKLGNLKSIKEFIEGEKYLGGICVKVQGSKDQIENLTPDEKIKIASFVIEKIIRLLNREERKYKGSKEFIEHKLNEIIKEKVVLYLDDDSPRAQGLKDLPLENVDWFAQNEIWGTSEENAFLKFFEEIINKFKEKYNEVSILRNENFFKIYSFDTGEGFSPDFVMLLRKNGSNKNIILQVFIEAKGDEFHDKNLRFEDSKEGWKQKFLLKIEKEARTKFDVFKTENKDFKLIGLPFFNEGNKNKKLKKEFEEALENKLLF